MSYFNRLKTKWGVDSNRQLWVIFIVFGITGSSSVKVGRPFLEWIGLEPHFFNEIPADLIANNSFLSPIFPKVIIEDNNMEIGSAKGTNRAEA